MGRGRLALLPVTRNSDALFFRPGDNDAIRRASSGCLIRGRPLLSASCGVITVDLAWTLYFFSNSATNLLYFSLPASSSRSRVCALEHACFSSSLSTTSGSPGFECLLLLEAMPPSAAAAGPVPPHLKTGSQQRNYSHWNILGWAPSPPSSVSHTHTHLPFFLCVCVCAVYVLCVCCVCVCVCVLRVLCALCALCVCVLMSTCDLVWVMF